MPSRGYRGWLLQVVTGVVVLTETYSEKQYTAAHNCGNTKEESIIRSYCLLFAAIYSAG